jgi:hypothetical protein
MLRLLKHNLDVEAEHEVAAHTHLANLAEPEVEGAGSTTGPDGSAATATADPNSGGAAPRTMAIFLVEPLVKPLDMVIERFSKSCYKLYGMGKGMGQKRFLLVAHKISFKRMLRIYTNDEEVNPTGYLGKLVSSFFGSQFVLCDNGKPRGCHATVDYETRLCSGPSSALLPRQMSVSVANQPDRLFKSAPPAFDEASKGYVIDFEISNATASVKNFCLVDVAPPVGEDEVSWGPLSCISARLGPRAPVMEHVDRQSV